MISRAGKEEPLRVETNAKSLKQTQRLYHEHKGRYGSPRKSRQLRQERVVCGLDAEGLIARRFRRVIQVLRCPG
jgi:hypothetical protein